MYLVQVKKFSVGPGRLISGLRFFSQPNSLSSKPLARDSHLQFVVHTTSLCRRRSLLKDRDYKVFDYHYR